MKWAYMKLEEELFNVENNYLNTQTHANDYKLRIFIYTES